MVDKVRDVAIIGFLLEHQIILRYRAGCLLGCVLRDVGNGFVFILRRQGRARSLYGPCSPSGLAGAGTRARGRDRRCARARVLGSARRAYDRASHEVIEPSLARLAQTFRAACRPGILNGGADSDLAMLSELRAEGAAGASPDGASKPNRQAC